MSVSAPILTMSSDICAAAGIAMAAAITAPASALRTVIMVLPDLDFLPGLRGPVATSGRRRCRPADLRGHVPVAPDPFYVGAAMRIRRVAPDRFGPARSPVSSWPAMPELGRPSCRDGGCKYG